LDEAKNRMYDFLANVRAPTNRLVEGAEDANNATVIANYTALLASIETILSERRTTLLPRQATIFTTNYDLFIEQASIGRPALRLTDGFVRVPSLASRMEFSSRNFFTTTYDTGNVYAYRVEVPTVNLIKLHGSLSWSRASDVILFDVKSLALLPEQKTPDAIQAFLDAHAIVLPQASKFQTTVLDRTYYDLLRIYANTLDRENTLLLSFGFSFGDEHILDITKRALKNPTLRLVVFAYNHPARDRFAALFEPHLNVDVIALADTPLDFAAFNELLRSTLPVGVYNE